MIAKKSKKADLEKKRFAFFQIGLIVSGAMCLAAFEYSSAEKAPEEKIVFEPTMDVIPPDLVVEMPEQPKSQPKTRQITRLTPDITITKEPVVDKGLVDPKDKDILFDDEDDNTLQSFGYTYVPEKDSVYEGFVDHLPEFPGGEAAMGRFIQDNFEMPEEIFGADEGTVYVQFVVNKNGSIEQVAIGRGVSDELDEAALEVVQKMPRWAPGENAGKPVRVRYTLPIMIRR